VQEFQVSVPDADVEDLVARLRRTRFPADFANDGWEQGFPTAYLRELVGYWAEQYDWRAQERRLNALPQFRTEIDGMPIHFVHVRGTGPDPQPLLLHHGWPETVWDLAKVIGPLTDPAAHGGDPADSFDVVAMSLPGHAWSSPLDRTGLNFWAAAEVELQLMDLLGYDRFFTAGGDWGACMVEYLGHAHADRVRGLYCHMPVQLSQDDAYHGDAIPDMPYGPDQMPAPEVFAEDEKHWLGHNERIMNEEYGYAWMHFTKPQTLANALNDSPAGIASWLLEKRRTWADSHGDIESVWTKDELCTTASIYWFTQTIGTSMRFYKEQLRNPWRAAHDRVPVVEAPSAVAVYRGEIAPYMPRAWTQRYFNLKSYTEHERGGHFAAAEVPDLFVADVRSFFRTLR
jgi:pimeloyl-ACP methyl ester carboxylesterase